MTDQSVDNRPSIDKPLLEKICSSQRWQALLLTSLSLNSGTTLNKENLIDIADKAFCQLEENDWLDAFAGHPMIGDISTLREKYAQGKGLSENEQNQVSDASETVLQSLFKLNHAYLNKFGFIFIICATNKSAQEMRDILHIRLNNSRVEELLNASVEQRKISHIRMEALL
ncbi:2-oxo-4-hydroxy-4-carboxy-5-ureidoimidazoline decarboxylase [Vibrio sp. F74]|uniref:2-oxo-4-hydroxy-4-carboxy-5-ureidoimidazoline decarboxylase n=1 Tax=Vibrio sp. F74 TaxID=700020 RepID=UPI0035F559CF